MKKTDYLAETNQNLERGKGRRGVEREMKFWRKRDRNKQNTKRQRSHLGKQ